MTSTETETSTETAGQQADTDGSGDGDQHDDAAGDQHDDADKPGAEAARYRRKLRTVEGERDALAGQLDATRRGIVDAQAAGLGIRPAALWAAGAELDELLADDGSVDAGKVEQAVRAAKGVLGLDSGPRPNPQQGRGSAPQSGGSWNEVLRRK